MPKVIFTERDELLALHYMLLTRQMTRLSDCLLHIIRLHTQGDDDGKLFKGYRGYAQTELADVIHHVKKFCEILGISFDETVHMAYERDKEKREEFLRKHPGEYWI